MRSFSATDALLILTVLIWGANYSVIKASLQEFQPLAFNMLRFSIASLVMLSILWYRERSLRVPKGDLWKILLLAFLGNTLYQVLFIEGIHLTRAGDATLILALMPLTILLLGAALGLESFRLGNAMATLISLVGVWVAIRSTSLKATPHAENPILGNLLIACCVIFWALYTLYSAPLMKHMSALRFSALTMALGASMLFPISVPQIAQQDWNAISWAAWGGLFYSALLALVFCYLVWYHGVRTLGNSQTTIYSNLSAPFGMLVAWAILGEDLNRKHLLGTVMVLAGIFINRKIGAKRFPLSTGSSAPLGESRPTSAIENEEISGLPEA